jgi:hypothetical protein
MSKRKRNILIVIGVLIVYLIVSYFVYTKYKDNKQILPTEDVSVVATMSDTITKDSSWCATFQLVWNEMKNEVVKKDIVFYEGNPETVDNLNKEEFDQSMISSDYYYIKYGLKTLDLKKEIENGIKQKFGQTSDILDSFDWSDSGVDDPNNNEERRYFFYTMLYRKFEFLKEFDLLDNDMFGNKYENVEYFGIENISNTSIKGQIEVLYYNSMDDFAILINTKSNDEVIYYKNPEGSNFNEIYSNMMNKAKQYEGNKILNKRDEFKAPKISLNITREYEELENKRFSTADPIYGEGKIEKAIQTIKFNIDEKGGEIKSEAAIDKGAYTTSVKPEDMEEPRYFNVDDTFVLFLREKGKSTPYFALRVEDITKFQTK